MTSLRWVGAHAYRDHANDRTIEPGEEIPEDIAEQLAESHPYDVEEIDEESDEPAEDEDEPETSSDPDGDESDSSDGDENGEDSADGDEDELEIDPEEIEPHPSEVSVKDLRDRIADVESEATLRAIRQLEEESDEPRSTALEAIDARINAVTE